MTTKPAITAKPDSGETLIKYIEGGRRGRAGRQEACTITLDSCRPRT